MAPARNHNLMGYHVDTARIRRVREPLWFLRSALNDRERNVILAGLREGRLVRVLRGCFVDKTVWTGWFPEERLLARTIAVAEMNARYAPLFSHHSAAVLWGLPLFRLTDLRVHLLTPTASPGRSSQTVMRHIGDWRDDEEVHIAGIRATSVTRTLLDLARIAAPEMAITAADAGMRALFGSHRANDGETSEEWRDAQLLRLDEIAGHRGVRRARQIIALADPRADSPAESVSRLYFDQLGVAVEIQVPVVGPTGANYRVDFEFLGQGAFGEVDGNVKYLDPAFRGGRTAEEIVLHEKEREDEIRGVTGNSMVRWGMQHLDTVRSFGGRLRAYGIRVPRLDALGGGRRDRERFR